MHELGDPRSPFAPAIDHLDRRLIQLLQANARESTAMLARKLGVARTTVVARLARLESSGQIVGYTARLGGDAAGRSVQAFVGVTVSPSPGATWSSGCLSCPNCASWPRSAESLTTWPS